MNSQNPINSTITIQDINDNAVEFRKLFLSTPFRQLFKSKKYRASLRCFLVLLFIVTPGIIWLHSTSERGTYSLALHIFPVILTMFLLAIENIKLTARARATGIPLHLRNRRIKEPIHQLQLYELAWFLDKTGSPQKELLKESKNYLEAWNHWKDISIRSNLEQQALSGITRFIFKPPSSASFFNLITASFAILAALLIAAGNITPESFFNAITDTQTTYPLIAITIVFLAEAIIFTIMVTSFLSAISRTARTAIFPNDVSDHDINHYLKEMAWMAGLKSNPNPIPKPIIILDRLLDILLTDFIQIIFKLLNLQSLHELLSYKCKSPAKQETPVATRGNE